MLKLRLYFIDDYEGRKEIDIALKKIEEVNIQEFTWI